MCQDYIKLTIKSISPRSVKTDAFTIETNDVEKAREVLEMKDGLGEWRTDNT